jgi:hypothetical protein
MLSRSRLRADSVRSVPTTDGASSQHDPRMAAVLLVNSTSRTPRGRHSSSQDRHTDRSVSDHPAFCHCPSITLKPIGEGISPLSEKSIAPTGSFMIGPAV